MKIRTSILSFGMSGKIFHAPFIEAHPEFDLRVICERSKTLSQEVYPNVKVVRSIDEAIKDEEVDLVIVNTPSITHYEYAMQALHAGKHVVVEKPFTVDSVQGQELVDLAASKNLVLAVYQNRRNDSELLSMMKVIESGKLGELVEVEMHFDRFAPDLSYKTHKEQDVKGVGIVYDLGSHLIDSALYVFGKPLEIYADAARTRKVTSVDDMFEIQLYYPGFKVILKASSFALQAIPSFIVHGQNGSFLCSRINIQEERLLKGIGPTDDAYLQPVDDKAQVTYMEDGVKKEDFIDLEIGNYMTFFDQVAGAILRDNKTYVDGQAGLNVIKVIEHAYQSMQLKKRLPFI